ncbi:phage portal protein [Micromonospora sp. CB01531]|uniref:phage portal protein n=1 Tax=Micromonospora sp. CB01531 TaxID=1718947 RepID=UPI001F517D80|nr:phage portal protein [Micromonospora sp. CB01531]
MTARHRAMSRPGGDRKQWSEPPFWRLDQLRSALLGVTAPDREGIEHEFEGYVQRAGKANAVVFSCCYARLRVFADAQFLWRDRVDGQLGAHYDSPDLALLRRPWPTGTLANLLAWMEVDATYAGNSYWTVCDDEGRYGRDARGPGRRLTRLRPDWVTLVIDSASGDPYAIDARVVGLIFEPPSSGVGGVRTKPVLLMPDEVCHYSPIPDPAARFRGMSWLTPVLREIGADLAATEHKQKFFENGAALSTVVSLDKDVTPEQFAEFVQLFKAQHEGPRNAYKTLFFGGGADVTMRGVDLKNLDFKQVQGGGETRIAAAAGVHPVVVGLSEGLSGSSLNAGNYSAARRNVADGTLRHLWNEAGASLETLFPRPRPTAELLVDTRETAFVREDAKDIAQIQQTRATALRALIDAGWDPDAAVDYLRTDDLARLVGHHSGLFSVQLQPLGSGQGGNPSSGGGTA